MDSPPDPRADALRMLDHSPAAQFLLDRQGIIRHANPAAARLMGLSVVDMVGRPGSALTHPDDAARSSAAVARLAAGEVDQLEITLRRVRGDGGLFWGRSTTALVRDGYGEVAYWVSGLVDVDAQIALEADLRRQAEYDELTGVLNRRGTMAALRAVHAEVGDDRLAVAIVDLHGVRTVNDSLGHEAGDQLLRTVARRLSGLGPGHGLAVLRVGRLGGDEFAVLAAVRRGALDPGRLARRIVEVFDEPVELDGVAHRQQVGVGLAVVSRARTGRVRAYDTASSALADADMALGEAKAERRSAAVVCDDALRARWVDRFRVVADVRRALAGDGLELHYQPVVDLASGAVAGREALLRLRGADGGLRAPDEFLPVVAETDLMVEIGSWVLRRACAQAVAWGYDGPYVAVNVSPRQLTGLPFAREVAAVLAETRMPARRLRLEVTEHVLAAGPAVVAALEAVRSLGVRVCVDDFGAGWSSLASLAALPLDVLKLDRGFLRDGGDRAAGPAVVAVVLQLARALGLVTVAEGVETPAQLALLRGLGYDYGQGMLLGPPEPLPEG